MFSLNSFDLAFGLVHTGLWTTVTVYTDRPLIHLLNYIGNWEAPSGTTMEIRRIFMIIPENLFLPHWTDDY